MILRWVFAFLLIAGIFQTFLFPEHPVIDHWETVVMANDTWHYFVGLNSGPPAGLAKFRI